MIAGIFCEAPAADPKKTKRSWAHFGPDCDGPHPWGSHPGIHILGFTAFGADGSERMAAVQTTMLGGLPYTVPRNAIFAHPTAAEGLDRLRRRHTSKTIGMDLRTDLPATSKNRREAVAKPPAECSEFPMVARSTRGPSRAIPLIL